jgi:hypothetical protein
MVKEISTFLSLFFTFGNPGKLLGHLLVIMVCRALPKIGNEHPRRNGLLPGNFKEIFVEVLGSPSFDLWEKILKSFALY